MAGVQGGGLLEVDPKLQLLGVWQHGVAVYRHVLNHGAVRLVGAGGSPLEVHPQGENPGGQPHAGAQGDPRGPAKEVA